MGSVSFLKLDCILTLCLFCAFYNLTPGVENIFFFFTSSSHLGKIQRLPRFDENDQVVARQITYISWSADHRCIEGAVMARFSNKMKAYLEQPAAMLLHTR